MSICIGFAADVSISGSRHVQMLDAEDRHAIARVLVLGVTLAFGLLLLAGSIGVAWRVLQLMGGL